MTILLLDDDDYRSLLRLKEGPMGWKFVTEMDLKKLFETLAPDTIATDEHINKDTGEIYWEEGTRADSSSLYPKPPEEISENDIWDRRLFSEPEDLLNDRIDAFIEELELDGEDYENLCDVAPDLAEGFFYFEPRWEDLLAFNDLEKEDVLSMISDLIVG
jgi:hypothetical protein